jgi:hypothetical protein
MLSTASTGSKPTTSLNDRPIAKIPIAAYLYFRKSYIQPGVNARVIYEYLTCGSIRKAFYTYIPYSVAMVAVCSKNSKWQH